LVLGGCATYSNQVVTDSSGKTAEYVPPVQHYMLAGIPLPQGFELVSDQSIGRASAHYRDVVFIFSGSRDVATVRRFFRENMPAAQFQLRKEWYYRGESNLRFDSSTEECNVSIRPGRFNRTTIVLDIGPLPDGNVDAEETAAGQP